MHSSSIKSFAFIFTLGAAGCSGTDDAPPPPLGATSVGAGGTQGGTSQATGSVTTGSTGAPATSGTVGSTTIGGVSAGVTTGGQVTSGNTTDAGSTTTGSSTMGGVTGAGATTDGTSTTGNDATTGFGSTTDGGAGGGFGANSTSDNTTSDSTTGGATTGGIPNTCSEGEETVCDNGIDTHCDYTYEYWKDQGSGCMVLQSDGFSIEWSNINNLLARKGVRPGSPNSVVTYDANYQPNGNSYLTVYGWTTNPLVEYYIVDSWGTWRPPGGEGFMGTVESDGGTYDIYRTQRVNQPSIQGTATFYQYWSVRTEKRSSGSVTVQNHFSAWANVGMNMGSLYEVSMCVEGYQSSGTADVSLSIQ